MGIITKLKSIRDNFDKYMMASAYAEAGVPHLALELLEDQERPRKSNRPKVRQRPRQELRPPR
ncbi:hypothetical protein ACFL03_13430 [Thermodesulfobacteriota bacterium]